MMSGAEANAYRAGFLILQCQQSISQEVKWRWEE